MHYQALKIFGMSATPEKPSADALVCVSTNKLVGAGMWFLKKEMDSEIFFVGIEADTKTFVGIVLSCL